MTKKTYILRDGQIRLNCIDAIQTLPEGTWQVTIEPYKKKRSLALNNLMWQWLTELSDETGYTKDELHEFFKGELLTPVVVTVGERARETSGSTAKLSTPDMIEYMEHIQRMAAEHIGVQLLWPEEYRAA